MLKHSVLSQYGSNTGVSSHPQQQTPNPLASSSHSGDTSLFHQTSPVVDPTRFIEGPPTLYHHQSKGYLDPTFPGIHSSRGFLESTRISRKDDYSHHLPGLSSPPSSGAKRNPMNGSIYVTSPEILPPPVPPPPNLNLTGASSSHPHHHHHNPQHSSTRVMDETVNSSNITSTTHQHAAYFRHGVLRSLSLLSILSLLLALNSLFFLLQIVSPHLRKFANSGEMEMIYEVTLCLSAMCLSINLCVLLVTSAQYFFAVTGSPGSTSFLQKVTVTRGIAIGGFFLSIPIFLSAIVLYTFTHVSFSPPSLIATACVGAAIIFGGCAMVHHVFTWQQEKTSKRALHSNFPATVASHPTLELSTLV